MPQISKIRIVNCNYNDGNRLIPDELYDLESPESGEALNSLFNLNNGGGKTVLAQLMMQPIVPRAKAGNRRIEDYFTRPSDHTYVILEWKKDNSKEHLLTGIAIAASSSNSTSDESDRGNSIKYYTFLSEYADYSPYSIASLELSKKENNRFTAESFDYVRIKAKSSNGQLAYYTSDESVAWERKLAEYGIYKSEWESVIETLNKDEGGLNQYFDDAKTSDKLIAKFFIPAIEKNTAGSVTGDQDSSLDTMLLNYAQHISDKEETIEKSKLSKRLNAELNELKNQGADLYAIHERLTKARGNAFGFKAALTKRIQELSEQLDILAEQCKQAEAELNHIQYEEKSKKYYQACKSLEEAQMKYDQVSDELEQCKAEVETAKLQETLLECARAYNERRTALASIESLEERIRIIEGESDEATQIAKLKYSVKCLTEENSQSLQETIMKHEKQQSDINGIITGLQTATGALKSEISQLTSECDKIEGQVDEKKKQTDKIVAELSLPVIRQFDTFYSEADIEAESEARKALLKKQNAERESFQKKEEACREDLDTIPKAITKKTVDQKEKQNGLANVRKEVESYNEAYSRLCLICEKYSLPLTTIFNGILLESIASDKETTIAKQRKCEDEIKQLQERIDAANTGHVHILAEIMKYIEAVGVNCQTGEEYLCGLFESAKITMEKMNEVLGKHPEIAYAVLFDDEKTMQSLLSAGNVSWLQSAVPLLTMSDMEKIMKGEYSGNHFLAVYDEEYFHNREGYLAKLNEQETNLTEQIGSLTVHLSECEKDLYAVKSFHYDSDWESEKKKEADSFEQDILKLTAEIDELVSRQSELKLELDAIREEIQKLERDIKESQNWLDKCAGVLLLLEEERSIDAKYQEKKIQQKCKESELSEKRRALEDTIRQSEKLEAALKDCMSRMEKVDGVLAAVEDAEQTEVIVGSWEDLYQQYLELSKKNNSSVEELRDQIKKSRGIVSEADDVLRGANVSEEQYANALYSSQRYSEVKKSRQSAEEKRDSVQKDHTEAVTEKAKAEQRQETAGKELLGFGGEPLPKNEIGEDFTRRSKECKDRLNTLSSEMKEADHKHSDLKHCSGDVFEITSSLVCPEKTEPVILESDVDAQWRSLKKVITETTKEYEKSESKLISQIHTVAANYATSSIAEVVSKLESIVSMLTDSGIRGDRLFTAFGSIDAMIESVEKMNRKFETDLQDIENEYRDLVEHCMIQAKRLYTDLLKICNSSRAQIFEVGGQTQMVKMDLPDEKEISEGASRAAIEKEIDFGANELKTLLLSDHDDKAVKKKIKSVIGSEKLLHKFIGKDSIQVRVYKIDINRENSGYKKWEDALTQNSGAEKFVVFFSVVLTLMNYTRSTAGFADKSAKSVLILDNPFGKITSGHLLRPMFEIAKHFRVQLICLSDINKSDVINCFENVIKLVIKSQMLSNKEILTHDGNERIEHGYYKIMNGQMSLF